MKEILIFFVAQWYLSLFCQTFFLHRYAAHGAFTMSKFTERLFFILTWILQGASYLSPFGYGVMHRMHHAYPDTEKDPHSPLYDGNFWKMMWKTKRIYSAIANCKIRVEERFYRGVPTWPLFDKMARSWPSRLFWGILYGLFYWHFATVWWVWLLFPIQCFLSPVHGAIINWFAHKYGYRNFEVKDTSTNLLPVDFLMMGESYHNNHHKYGSRPNFGSIRWHEIDVTYLVILFLHKIRVIRLVAR